MTLRIAMGAWTALGIINRGDVLVTLQIFEGRAERPVDKRSYYKPLADWISEDTYLHFPEKEYYNEWLKPPTECMHLWYTLQRMNVIVEILSYEEQECLLEELLAGKWQKCLLARTPKNCYN